LSVDRVPTGFLSDRRRATALNALVLKRRSSFRYVCAFGDHWVHEVPLEKIVPPSEAPSHPLCLAGERAFPHEDSGSVYEYLDMVDVRQAPPKD
jgi:hypothetical protein